jgi:glycosyltransferase involved in cell wall biosynthesis
MEISSAIEQVVNDSGLRDKLRVKGFERAQQFDWQETARRTLSVYEEVVHASMAMNSPKTGLAQ